MFLAVPSMVAQYAEANFVIIWSNVWLLSETSSPYELSNDWNCDTMTFTLVWGVKYKKS